MNPPILHPFDVQSPHSIFILSFFPSSLILSITIASSMNLDGYAVQETAFRTTT